MAHTGLSNSQFADQAGVPRPTLSQLLHGRNKSISDQFLRKLNEGFPELDVRWLLFGTGSMLTNVNSQTSEPQNTHNILDCGNENAETQQDLSSEMPGKTSPISIPKEISDIMGGIKTAPHPASAPISQVADPFVYEVRPLSSSENDADATPQKKVTPKKVTSIIVLYSDGSFETFTPAE